MRMTQLRAVPSTNLDPIDVALVAFKRALGDGLDERAAMERALRDSGVVDALAEADALRGQVAERDLQIETAGRALAAA